MEFRIGINLGDLLGPADGTVYGDGVNLAARVQALGLPGAIALARRAHALLNAAGVEPGEAGADADGRSTAAPTVPRLPSRPSLAVLPFSNLGGEAENGYLAGGITADIITELSRFRELVVTARNPSFHHRGQAVDLRQMGQELEVRFVLEGSVRHAGTRIRVNAQLIDAGSGQHPWAEPFDRNLQDELIRRIVASLVGQLSGHEFRRVRSAAPTGKPEAYDLVLRGRGLWFGFNCEDNLQARALCDEAIALDPDFARAYSSLAWSHISAYNAYWSDDLQRELDTALDHAPTGVELAPALYSPRLAAGYVLLPRAARTRPGSPAHRDRFQPERCRWLRVPRPGPEPGR
jgi:adenylate cyclase